MVLKLLFYGYCVGVRSSRHIEQKTYEDVAFRVLSCDTHPDHSRTSDFRKRHLPVISDLFVQVLELCKDSPLPGGGNQRATRIGASGGGPEVGISTDAPGTNGRREQGARNEGLQMFTRHIAVLATTTQADTRILHQHGGLCSRTIYPMGFDLKKPDSLS